MNKIVFYSSLVLGSIGIFVMYWMQHKSTTTYNSLEAALEERPYFVKKLDLSRHKSCIDSLPKTLEQLTALEEVDMRELSLTTIDSNLLKSWTKLEDWNLGKNLLEELPSTIRYCTHLKGIDIQQNYLGELPKELFQLPHLVRIDASRNNLHTLPSAWNLPNLGHLDLEYNALMVYPSEVGKLSGLDWLVLSHNYITTIPDTATCPSSLVILELENNPIGQLPDAFFRTNTKTLGSLYLNDTNIEQLPSSLQEMTNLEDLSIGGTKITTLPDWIGKLTKLESLDISNTEIKTFPESMKNLKYLQEIWIGYDMPLETRAELEKIFPNVAINGGGY